MGDRICAICGKPVSEKEVTLHTVAGEPVCGACEFDIEKEYCEGCGAALAPDMVVCEGGHGLCAVCYADGIGDCLMEEESV